MRRTLFYDNPYLLALTVLAILVAGLSALSALPRLEDPRITTRNAVVVTLYPGASAQRVEALVTEPIEQALREVVEVKQLDSISRAGVSSVAIELQAAVTASTNDEIFSRIRDKLAGVQPELPAAASTPLFDDERGAVAFTLLLALTWQAEGDPQLGILNRHARTLADRLRTVPGTELVRVYGDPAEEIRVTLDRDQAAELGVSAQDVANTLAAADAKRPAGLQRGRDTELTIEVAGALDGLQRVRNVPLFVGDAASVVRIGDIAEVGRGGRQPPDQIALTNGQRGVLVGVRVASGQRVGQWANKARAVVVDYRARLDPGIGLVPVFDQAEYTNARLGMLTTNLLLGALVVMAVVLLAMGWRAALVVGTALPLVAALSLFGLLVFGGSLHQISIFGLILALGLLIDNAIVVTDEVRKRRIAGDDARTALAGTLGHLFLPLLASTLTTILAFAPIILLPGGVGDFVGWIGGSVILALAFSFLVAISVIAALAARYLRPNDGSRPRDGWLTRGLSSERVSRATRSVLRAAVRRPVRAIALTLIAPAIGFVLFTRLGSEFFPPVDRNMFDVKVWLDRQASVERTRAAVAEIEAAIREDESVKQVHWLVGNSFPSVYYNLVMNVDNAPYYSQGVVETGTAAQVDALVPWLQTRLDARFPDAQIVLRKFAQGPPVNAPVEYKLYGPEIATLQDLGERLRGELQRHDQVLHTRVSLPRGEPKLWFEADEDQARLAGLSLSDLADQLQVNLEGAIGGSVIEDMTRMPVRVRVADSRRADASAIESGDFVRVGADGPRFLPVSALGTFRLRPELAAVARTDAVRTNIVEGYVTQGALAIDVTRAVLARFYADGFELPAGYRLELAGDAEQSGNAQADLITYAPILGTLMVATLILAFRSLRIFAILTVVALLSTGLGFAATWLIGFPRSFNTILGTFGVVGLAFNSSIIVLAAIRSDARADSGDPDALAEAVLGTGRHLLSTTLTTIGGFLPLLLLTGGNFWPSLAIVLVGGVPGSTLLAMLFTPPAYVLLFRLRRQSADATASQRQPI